MQLVIVELATNLEKHAKGGVLILKEIQESDEKGVLIQSLDWGPGIADVNEAMRDRFSTSGSLGLGLGTVNRLMDEIRIEPRAKNGQGTVITCKKLDSGVQESSIRSPLQIGAASRPHPNMRQNGDSFVVKSTKDTAFFAVIDGLGHGQFAHRASHKARLYLENHYKGSFNEIFRGVGYECRSTRGVVMSAARIDWKSKKLSLASIGNVETKIYGSLAPVRIPTRRGILGQGYPKPKIIEQDWDPMMQIVMFSDGLSSHWHEEDVQRLSMESAQKSAAHFLRKYAKDSDDATILIAKTKKS